MYPFLQGSNMESREAAATAQAILESAFRDIENAGIRPYLMDPGRPTNMEFDIYYDGVELVLRNVLVSRGPQ